MLLDSSKAIFKKDPNTARELLDQVKIKSKEISFDQGLGHYYQNLGSWYYFRGDLNEAIENYNKADSIYSIINDSSLLTAVYSNRGVAYILLKDYDHALDDLLKALEINTIRNDEERIAVNNLNIGGIYFQEKQYEKAWLYYSKAAEYDMKVGDSLGLASILGNMGGIRLYQNRFEEAKYYFTRCKKIYETEGTKNEQITIANHFGILYEKQGKQKKARSEYLKAVSLSAELDSKRNLFSNMGNVATTYFNEEKFDSAAIWIKKEIKVLEQIGDSNYLRKSYRDLAECYLRLNRYKESLDAMVSYDSINSALNKREKDRLIKNLEMKTELFNKDIELRASKQERYLLELESKKRLIIILVVSIIAFLIVVSLIVLFLFREQRAKTRNALLENQLLRSKINPHFIFNVFNSIQAYLLNKDYETGSEYLRKFAKLIRGFLEKTDQSLNSIKEEIEMIDLYLSVEKLRVR